MGLNEDKIILTNKGEWGVKRERAVTLESYKILTWRQEEGTLLPFFQRAQYSFYTGKKMEASDTERKHNVTFTLFLYKAVILWLSLFCVLSFLALPLCMCLCIGLW